MDYRHIRWPQSHSWCQWILGGRNRCSCLVQCCYKWLHSDRVCDVCSSSDLRRKKDTCNKRGLVWWKQQLMPEQQLDSCCLFCLLSLASFHIGSFFCFCTARVIVLYNVYYSLLFFFCYFCVYMFFFLPWLQKRPPHPSWQLHCHGCWHVPWRHPG